MPNVNVEVEFVDALTQPEDAGVCRRLNLVEGLDATLSATAARELAQLPRGNQLRAGVAFHLTPP